MRHEYPHFLVVGMMKAGTTTVYEHLSSHPRVAPARFKELHYFTRDFRLWVEEETWGLEYSEMLNAETARNLGQLTGEASPSYIAVPERIFDFNPDCKIIVMLRDPVSRVLSQMRQNIMYDFAVPPEGYLSQLRSGKYLATLDVIKDSEYLPRLERFLAIFPPENIAICSFEMLVSSPQALMNALFDFLGLPPIAIDERYVGAQTNEIPDEAEIIQVITKYFTNKRGSVTKLLEASGCVLIPNDIEAFCKY